MYQEGVLPKAVVEEYTEQELLNLGYVIHDRSPSGTAFVSCNCRCEVDGRECPHDLHRPVSEGYREDRLQPLRQRNRERARSRWAGEP